MTRERRMSMLLDAAIAGFLLAWWIGTAWSLAPDPRMLAVPRPELNLTWRWLATAP